MHNMTRHGSERRRSVRMNVEIATRLRFGDREVAFPIVKTCDMSAEGLGLIIRDGRDGVFGALDAWRDEVEVQLNMPDGNMVECPATIAWRRTGQDDDGEHLRLGLEFSEIGATDRKILERCIQ